MSSKLSARIEQASAILKPYLKDVPEGYRKSYPDDPDEAASAILKVSLEKSGVDDSEFGFQMLESGSVSVGDFEHVLRGLGFYFPSPRVRAAWNVLRGLDPFTTEQSAQSATTIAEVVKQIRPIGQW